MQSIYSTMTAATLDTSNAINNVNCISDDPPSLDGESQSTDTQSLPSDSAFAAALPKTIKATSTSTNSNDAAVAPEDDLLLQDPSDFDVDKALSSELMGLSLETRLNIEEEIHGVRSEREESPAFLESKLEEFDRVLFAKKTKMDQEQKQDEASTQRRFLLRNVIQCNPPPSNSENNKSENNSTNNNSSYNNNNCYLNDPHVRLRFLRSESFDVPKAVERMICFLEFTSELYGDFVADRPIAISDFSKQEEYFLRHSRSQYLPFRDRSGRRVQVGVGSINFNIPAYVRFKIMMLLQWVVTEDVETQRKGIVIVLWPFDEQAETNNNTAMPSSPLSAAAASATGSSDSNNNNNNNNERKWDNLRRGITNDTLSYFQKYNNSMPVRIASVHQFYKDAPIYRALSALYVFYGLKREHWSIYRCHFGEEIENRYQLSNYGIPEALMPMTTTGKVKTDHQSNWVTMVKAMEEQKKQRQEQRQRQQKQRQQENNGMEVEPNLQQQLRQQQQQQQQQDEPTIVECPSSNDVVFRKGRPLYRRNPGNMHYRELIAAASFQHSEAGRSGKYAITWKIVQQIESKEGRFLEWSGGMWVVMTDRKAIRDKIASALKQYNKDHLKHSKAAKQGTNQNNKSQKSTSREQNVVTPTTEMNQNQAQPQGQKQKVRKASKDLSASEVLSGHLSAKMDVAFASTQTVPNPASPYLFLQPENRAYDNGSKRRRLTTCGGIANDCLPDNFNLANTHRMSGHLHPYHPSSNPAYNHHHHHKLNNAMGVFDMQNDSSCFGKFFFPTV